MSAFEGIVGHRAQQDYLEKVLKKGSHAHAYGFFGAKHLGKTTMAFAFGKALAGDQPMYLVERAIDEKTGAYKKSIPIESIRDLSRHMQLTTFDGGKKVALIQDADTLTIGAQNALLKTLEEPRGDSVILLVATRADALLPTIRSRTVQIHFAPVARETICTHLKQTHAENEAHALAGFAAGRPGVAMRLKEADRREDHTHMMQQARDFLSASLPTRIKTIETLVKAKDAQALSRTMQAWRQVLHDALLSCAGQPHMMAQTNEQNLVELLAEKKPASYWVQALDVLGQTEEALKKNVNANLALERFALSL